MCTKEHSIATCPPFSASSFFLPYSAWVFVVTQIGVWALRVVRELWGGRGGIRIWAPLLMMRGRSFALTLQHTQTPIFLFFFFFFFINFAVAALACGSKMCELTTYSCSMHCYSHCFWFVATIAYNNTNNNNSTNVQCNNNHCSLNLFELAIRGCFGWFLLFCTHFAAHVLHPSCVPTFILVLLLSLFAEQVNKYNNIVSITNNGRFVVVASCCCFSRPLHSSAALLQSLRATLPATLPAYCGLSWIKLPERLPATVCTNVADILLCQRHRHRHRRCRCRCLCCCCCCCCRSYCYLLLPWESTVH